ncbi:MAG: D-glycero-beta-D-manno-heptose 1-phosphate adenylyltransferase [Bacteroidia bacterium]
MQNYNEIVRKKIIDPTELSRVSHRERFFNKKIVFTNGCFDILHPGHVYYLNQAKSLGDVLVVGVNSDDSVRRLNKGAERPIHPQEERAKVLASLLCVDYVCIFQEDTPLELIKIVKPDVLVKGGDYTIDKIVGADIVLQNGGKVEIIPLLEGYSTTSIVRKLKS